jgi:hypothetical protein
VIGDDGELDRDHAASRMRPATRSSESRKYGMASRQMVASVRAKAGHGKLLWWGGGDLSVVASSK